MAGESRMGAALYARLKTPRPRTRRARCTRPKKESPFHTGISLVRDESIQKRYQLVMMVRVLVVCHPGRLIVSIGEYYS